MNEIKSKMFNTVASLGVVIALSATSQSAVADDSIDTTKEAIALLYPAALAVNTAQQSGNTGAQKIAGQRLTDAQREITALFGKEAEGNFSYTYEGNAVNVPIDCDLAFINVQAFTANENIIRENGNAIKQGEKYLQLSITPTLAMTTQFHLTLNGINPDPNPDIEKQMTAISSISLLPIGQDSTKNVATHVFAIPESVFSGNPNDRNLLPSIHKIPYSEVTNDMFEICEDRLDELNSDALDLFAKPQP